jgi:hypothetical protein
MTIEVTDDSAASLLRGLCTESHQALHICSGTPRNSIPETTLAQSGFKLAGVSHNRSYRRHGQILEEGVD